MCLGMRKIDSITGDPVLNETVMTKEECQFASDWLYAQLPYFESRFQLETMSKLANFLNREVDYIRQIPERKEVETSK